MGVHQKQPLAVFVLDAADIGLIERWLPEGRLPNLAALRQRGTFTRVQGSAYLDEIGSWTSAYTGTPPTRHGYYSTRRLKPGSYEAETYLPKDSGARPFWQLASDTGLRVAVLEPAEGMHCAGINGIQVFNLTVHQEAYARQPPLIDPPERLEELKRRMEWKAPLLFDRFERGRDYYRKELRRNLDQCRRRCILFRDLLREQPYDVAIVGFNEMHDTVHLVWPFFENPTDGQDGEDDLGRALQDIYETVDREIGEFLKILPEDAVICVLSTYGVKHQYPTTALGEELLQRLGLWVTRSAPAGDLGLKGIVRKAIPEPIRFEISKHLPGRVQEKLVRENFSKCTDWSRTRMFPIPSLYSNWLRVNLKGREPEGTVNPGEEYDQLLDMVEAEFTRLVDPVTGTSPIAGFRRTAGLYVDGPSELLPDLYVHWHGSRRFLQSVNHPLGEIRQRKPGFFRDSYHGPPGFVILAAPGVEARELDEQSVLDVAPTLLDILGCPQPDWMPGASFAPAAVK